VQADLFNLDFAFIAFTMLILGGAGRVLSPVVGAVLFWAALSFIGSILADLSASPGSRSSWTPTRPPTSASCSSA
jgi:branched-chain amino acid transport system permease protein